MKKVKTSKIMAAFVLMFGMITGIVLAAAASLIIHPTHSPIEEAAHAIDSFKFSVEMKAQTLPEALSTPMRPRFVDVKEATSVVQPIL